MDKKLELNDRIFTVRELSEQLLEIKPAERFYYLTDFSLNPENTPRVLSFLEGVGDADDVLIESNFCAEERNIAWQKGHLTTRQSALLAAFCKAKTYRNFHLSDKYVGGEAFLIEEAKRFFAEFRVMDRETLRKMIWEETQPKEECHYKSIVS